MTEITSRTRACIAARISGWVGLRQQELSDRVHAGGDTAARQHGWTVTATAGRFGFGTRSYRDPRFDDRRQQLAPKGAGRSHPSREAAIRPTRRSGTRD
jgi:hypothetical protein